MPTYYPTSEHETFRINTADGAQSHLFSINYNFFYDEIVLDGHRLTVNDYQMLYDARLLTSYNHGVRIDLPDGTEIVFQTREVRDLGVERGHGPTGQPMPEGWPSVDPVEDEVDIEPSEYGFLKFDQLYDLGSTRRGDTLETNGGGQSGEWVVLDDDNVLQPVPGNNPGTGYSFDDVTLHEFDSESGRLSSDWLAQDLGKNEKVYFDGYVDLNGDGIADGLILRIHSGRWDGLSQPMKTFLLTDLVEGVDFFPGQPIDQVHQDLPLRDITELYETDEIEAITGTNSNDDLQGTIDDDFIKAGAGDDLVHGSDGKDLLLGEDGHDILHGGKDDDTVEGGDGNDFIVGGEGNDVIDAGSGDDKVFAGSGDAGSDTIFGGSGDDVLGGGAGDDQIYGGTGADTSFGGSGNDLIDERNTDTSSNVAWAGSGQDTVYGGDGDDVLGGGKDADLIDGGDGNDVIYAGTGEDNDTLVGGDGDDTIFAGNGEDDISGGQGNDLIFNGEGDDYVDGGAGADVIWGGAGEDILAGAADADTFAFSFGNGSDTITDFSFVEFDMLHLAGLGIQSEQDALSAMTDTEEGVLLSVGDTSVLIEGQSVENFASNVGWLDDTLF